MNPPPIVVGLGETVWDLFPETRRPGGATANVAYQATQLGAHGVVASRVGRDELGHELLAYLKAKGLDTSFIQTDASQPTGQVTVHLEDPAHPWYVIHENSSWDFLETTPHMESLADRAAAVCFGTLAQRSPVARRAVQQFIQRTRGLVVFDVNLRQKWYDRESIEMSLQRATIVKLNSEEIAPVADVLQLSYSSEQDFTDILRSQYPIQTVIITRAEHGCFLSGGNEEINLPGEQVTLVDAVGAGDAFTAAFIMLTLEGLPLELKARFANRVGAIVVEKAGAMPDVQDDYVRLRHEFGI